MRPSKIYVQHEFKFLLVDSNVSPNDIASIASGSSSMKIGEVKFKLQVKKHGRIIVAHESATGNVICDLYGIAKSQSS